MINTKKINEINLLFEKELNAGAVLQLCTDTSVWTKGFGTYANKEDNYLTNLKFPLYSISKTILAVFALDLHEKGVIDLDAPISIQLDPEIPGWLRNASLRHLLAHRSGLADYGSLDSYHSAVKANPSAVPEKNYFINEIFKKGPQSKLDDSFLYSNVGYYIIKEIIQNKMNLNLHDIFSKIVGSKLNIHMEYLSGTSSNLMDGISSYLSSPPTKINSLYNFDWVFHGSFCSDISNLNQLFFNIETLLTEKNFSEMTKLHKINFSYPHYNASYGLGLMGDMESKFGPIYGHNGGGPGFSTAVYRIPQKNIAIAAVVNHDNLIEAADLIFSALS